MSRTSPTLQAAVNKGGGALQKVLDKNPDVKKYLDIFTGGGEGQAPEGGLLPLGGRTGCRRKQRCRTGASSPKRAV